jgi:hypothetical protein
MSHFTPSNLLCLKYRVKRLAQASGPAPFVFLGEENQGGGARTHSFSAISALAAVQCTVMVMGTRTRSRFKNGSLKRV